MPPIELSTDSVWTAKNNTESIYSFELLTTKRKKGWNFCPILHHESALWGFTESHICLDMSVHKAQWCFGVQWSLSVSEPPGFFLRSRFSWAEQLSGCLHSFMSAWSQSQLAPYRKRFPTPDQRNRFFRPWNMSWGFRRFFYVEFLRKRGSGERAALKVF